MIKYIKEIISSSSDTSSKRFISLFFALVFMAVVIAHLCGVVVGDSIIWALVALISGGSIMGTIEKFKN